MLTTILNKIPQSFARAIDVNIAILDRFRTPSFSSSISKRDQTEQQFKGDG